MHGQDDSPFPGLLHLLDWHPLGLGQAEGRKERIQDHTAGKEEEHPILHRGTEGTSEVLLGKHAQAAYKTGSIWQTSCRPAKAWVRSAVCTCILQSMVLKNCPMMKLARKLKNTLMPCTKAAGHAEHMHSGQDWTTSRIAQSGGILPSAIREGCCSHYLSSGTGLERVHLTGHLQRQSKLSPKAWERYNIWHAGLTCVSRKGLSPDEHVAG